MASDGTAVLPWRSLANGSLHSWQKCTTSRQEHPWGSPARRWRPQNGCNGSWAWASWSWHYCQMCSHSSCCPSNIRMPCHATDCCPLGHHLHFGAGGTIEIRRLVVGSHPELFNAVCRRRHHTCWTTAACAPPRAVPVTWLFTQAARGVARETGGVSVHACRPCRWSYCRHPT